MQDVFIISPKTATERRRMLTERFAAIGCAAHFIDAVMGADLTDADKHPFLASKAQNYVRYAHRDTAIGASISHFKIWQMIADGAAEYGFIFEDDAIPIAEATDVESVMSKLSKLSGRIDVVSLFNSHRHRPHVPIHKLDAKFQLSVVRYNAHGGVAYMISKAAAQKLLNDPHRYVLGVDRAMFNWGLNGCDVLHLDPPLFIEDGRASTVTLTARSRWTNDRWHHKLARKWWILYSSLAKRLRLLFHARRMRAQFDKHTNCD